VQVVIACLTPRYVVSHHCNKEIALADLLHKPIIPVMYEQIPWPPGGAMSLIFAQLVYINLRCKFQHAVETVKRHMLRNFRIGLK